MRDIINTIFTEYIKCVEEKEYCSSTFHREQPDGERREESDGNTSWSSKPKCTDEISAQSRL